MYYSPDSHFNENTSTYLDFENFSFPNWLDIGAPSLIEELDDSSNFINAKLVWSLDSFKTAFYDTLDSNFTRTFGMQFPSSDSNFIQLYSEEAGYQTTDPKVLIKQKKSSSINIKNQTDTFEQNIYEKNIKRNFASSIRGKLISAILSLNDN